MTATVAADEAAALGSGSPATLPALDSMRAVAAVAVVATHTSFWSGAYAGPRFGASLARLDIGVAIFFVLSGFLLSRPWFQRHARGAAPPSTGRYLWKRALRIMPVYVLAAAAALLLLPGNSGATPALWIKTLTLTNIYVDARLPDGLTQMWSLATEVAFYLALPLVMWVALSRRRDGRPSRSRLGTVLAVLVVLNGVWLLDLAERLDTVRAVERPVAAVVPHVVLGRDRTRRVLPPRPSARRPGAGALARVAPLLETHGAFTGGVLDGGTRLLRHLRHTARRALVADRTQSRARR